MGREIKRVALDFDYPINQMIWKGYWNPYTGLPCKVCDQSGQSPEYKELHTECSVCGGKGYLWPDDKYEEMYDGFTYIDPPSGEGYQLWSTTSEGTPMSPVFDTPEKLARWLADNNASSFGRNTQTYDEWLKFITGHAWALSMIMDSQGIKSGVEAAIE